MEYLILDLTINENEINIQNPDLKKIIKKVRPSWDLNHLEIIKLTNGITNKLIKCRLRNDPKDNNFIGNDNDVILVRIDGNNTDLLINREAEKRNVINLSKHNLGPKLYASFNNGIVYQYLNGVILTPETVRDPNISKLVAEKMAEFHKVEISTGIGRKNIKIQDQPEPMLWKNLEKFYRLIPDKFNRSHVQSRFKESINYSKAIWRTEIDFLKDLVSKNSSHKIVFCHNDLLLGNIIYNSQENSIKFIDFEYADYNYQYFDVANHFTEYPGIDSIDYSLFPSKDHQLTWIRQYLKVYNCTDNVSDIEVENGFESVKTFVLASHLLWGLWALVQAEHSSIDFDYIAFAKSRINEYFDRKESLLGK